MARECKRASSLYPWRAESKSDSRAVGEPKVIILRQKILGMVTAHSVIKCLEPIEELR